MTAPRKGSAAPRALVVWSELSARILLVIAAVVVVVYALAKLRIVVLPIVFAILLSTVLAPPVRWLRERGLPSAAAAGIVFVAALLLMFGVLAFSGAALVREFGDVGTTLQEGWKDVAAWAENTFGLESSGLAETLSSATEDLGADQNRLASGLIGGAVKALEILAMTLLTFFFTFFFLKDGEGLFLWAADRIGSSDESKTERAGLEAYERLGKFIRGRALISVIEAGATGIAFALIGLPLILPLMVIVFFSSFIPYAGAITMGVVAILIAAATGGFSQAIMVLVVVIVIQQVESNLLEPLVLGKVMQLHPAVVAASVAAGATAAGIVGAFLAIPVLAVAITLLPRATHAANST